MKNQRIGLPIIPRNKNDPTQSAKSVNKMINSIEDRYYGIKSDLRDLLDSQLIGVVSNEPIVNSAIICNNDGGMPNIYFVNDNTFQYTIDGNKLATIFEEIQRILDRWLLEGADNNIWAGEYVMAEYRRGMTFAYTTLSKQSEFYAQQTTLSSLLFSEPYVTRIGLAYASTYNDWKGISDAARADLGGVLAEAVARGINPRETAKILSDRLDVSMSKAKTIAQTEQVGAYRRANWDETEDVQTRLGLRTKLLHLSSLKATTRTTHAARHGRVYTVEEVRIWYTKDGNKYNCYCSQSAAIVDEYGEAVSRGLIDRLAEQRKKWQAEFKKAA
ncbi:phage head morphogenesis protein%2C SPP1 gp7 family [Yersinia frederiksenii]|nr:phage head morphogenesis protein%2C SPP1 gp7 family [Yersinia frederiksenii]